MNSAVRVRLKLTEEQKAHLVALQVMFARACNSLAEVVQRTRCWNRVTLHHLTYKDLRAQFPELGSQMVCNAIYSVCRSARMVFQHPGSPLHISRLDGKQLPLLAFAENSPVYFDRHTLSIKDGTLSMFTLGGRIRFRLALSSADEARFHHQKLREVVLQRTEGGYFELAFRMDEENEPAPEEAGRPLMSRRSPFPDYIKVEVPHES